jgi:hypothetical protein
MGTILHSDQNRLLKPAARLSRLEKCSGRHEFPSAIMKVWALGFLLFVGLSLIALAFVPAQAYPGTPTPLQIATWGLLCLLTAGVWMYWDHKRRVLTPDEEIEELLLDVAKRYRHTRSLETIVDEYRMRGASDETLMVIRTAPQSLRARGKAKVSIGMQLLAIGLLFTAAAYYVARVFGGNHYEVAIGAIGAGVGFVIQGIRQRTAFRQDAIT